MARRAGRVVEHASPRLQLSANFQELRNGGFNRDRGPVRFFAVRLHLEY
jgi:hypothetical protein